MFWWKSVIIARKTALQNFGEFLCVAFKKFIFNPISTGRFGALYPWGGRISSPLSISWLGNGIGLKLGRYVDMNKKNWFDPLMNDDVIIFFADVIKKMKIRYMKNGLIHYYQLYLEIIFCWFGKKYRTGNSKKNFLAKFLLLVTSFRWRHFKKKRTSNLTSWRHIIIFWRRQFFYFIIKNTWCKFEDDTVYGSWIMLVYIYEILVLSLAFFYTCFYNMAIFRRLGQTIHSKLCSNFLYKFLRKVTKNQHHSITLTEVINKRVIGGRKSSPQ